MVHVPFTGIVPTQLLGSGDHNAQSGYPGAAKATLEITNGTLPLLVMVMVWGLPQEPIG